MLDRIGQFLRVVCLVLAVLLVGELVAIAFRVNPLAHVVIPALPTLGSDTNAPPTAPGGTNSPAPLAKGTNAIKTGVGTNQLTTAGGKTNATAKGPSTKAVTNQLAGSLTATNVAGVSNSSAVASSPPDSAASPAEAAEAKTTDAKESTNAPTDPATARKGTNAPPTAASATVSHSPTTNLAVTGKGTNRVKPGLAMGTNVARLGTNVGTNISPGPVAGPKGPNAAPGPQMAMPGMPFGLPGMGGKPPAPLPPEIKARVDRIYESELLGQVMHPLPMGLLGIAGQYAILRSPSGQTGLVKEGDALGELTLLRIGINRVLVEQGGQKKELTIFDGYGGESLMPKETESHK